MFSKLVRIGRDAELKYTPTGTVILEINAVYDVGFGDKKEPQWIRLAMFGQRAEKLASHFTKGTQIVIHADDIKARAYTAKSGEAGCSLEAKLVDFQFVGGGNQQQAPQPQQQGYQNQPNPTYQQQAPYTPPQNSGQNMAGQQAPQMPTQEFDDSIPF